MQIFSLQHDLLTRRAATGILHLLNQTPGDWYSEQQATVETAAFLSELTASRIAVDQILGLRTTLRYLAVTANTKSYMFEDNQAVVTNSTIPHSSLNKRHNALSYHRVREMIAAKILGYYWIYGKKNPADVARKHWGHQQVLTTLYFFSGDTEIILDDGEEDIKEVNNNIIMVILTIIIMVLSYL
jgi:hypothetical protein